MLRLGSSLAPKVFLQKEYWLLLCLHCFTFAYYNNGFMGQKDGGWRLSTLELEWSDVELMFILMSCALCFAVHQAYCRYLYLGDLVWKMMDSIYDFAFEARILLRDESQPFDRLGCRWIVGSMALALCEVRLAGKGQRVGQADLLKLVDLEFMRPGEADFMEELASGQQRTLVMLHTAAECMLHGLRQKGVAPAMIREVMQRLTRCKSLQLQLLDTANATLPFQYVHLLSLLITFVCAILGICMGICDSWIAPPAYAATLLIILGLFELLGSLSNPFDSLEADFPVQSWVSEFLSNLTVLLNYEHSNDQWKAELQDEIDNPVHFCLTEEQVLDILSGEVQRVKTTRAKVPPGYTALRAQADPEGPAWLRSVRFEDAEEKKVQRGWMGAALENLGEALGITADRGVRDLET